jgi:putative ABC transport system permease protein
MIKKLVDRFFRWYCDPDYYPDIKGDLEELYNRNSEKSIRSAERKYLLQVLGLFRPSLIRSFNQTSIINQGMFRNYFKVGTRNLLRHKLYTLINVVGLAIGLAAFLLISEYVRFEKSYESFFNKSEQIYRLSTIEVINGSVDVKDAMAYYPAAKALQDEIPEIQLQTTSRKYDEFVIKNGDTVFKEKGIISADSNFLKVFSHEVLQGSRETMFNEPYSVVLTESKARFFFGDEAPLGKTLLLSGEVNEMFQVSGILADIPENTHYKFDIAISDKSIKGTFDYDSWNYNNYYAYLVMDPNTDFEALKPKMETISKKYTGEDSNSLFDLFPIKDIHLKSDYTFEPELPGNEKAVAFMLVISVFILMIAWVNYINLSTARAVERAKEVGLRKVIGAFKMQLIIQFLFESMLVNLLASICAIFIAELSLSNFHQLIGTVLTNHIWNYVPFMQKLLIFFVLGTFVSGFYPAVVLSGFKPISVLKGKFSNSRSGILLRQSLVVFQFAASIVLIAGTLIVNKQVKFMRDKDIGINTDYVVGFTLPQDDGENEEAHYNKLESFKEELRNHVAIETVGATSNMPGGDGSDINSTTSQIQIVGLTDPVKGTTYIQFNDDHFLDAVDMQLLAGRNFNRERISDSSAVMVNAAFLKKFNVYNADSVVDKQLMFGDSEENDKYLIIGIVKDFNRTTLKSSIEPTIYIPALSPPNAVVELRAASYKDGIKFLEAKWKEFFPDTPLDYQFIDDRFEALYQQDTRFRDVFMLFSVLAIFIATLGLFGLTSFMALQRTKEVGVRKVLGATVLSIISIFYKDFILLLLISAFVGVPIVYYSMNFWLENYAFRIDFPWALAILSVLVVVVFALLTVGYQTYKVAILNPANTLKYE